MFTRSSPLKSAQHGIVLLEALIAILIFSFAILGLVGLQAAMIKNTSESKYRSDAGNIAQQSIGQMWSDSTNIASYIKTDENISTLLPNGLRTVALTGANQYTITITWLEPGNPQQHNYSLIASINPLGK